MRTANIVAFGLLSILIACKGKKEFQIAIEGANSKNDTLYIQEVITRRIIAQVPLDKLNSEYKFNIDEVTLGEITVKNAENPYLTIISPGARKIIVIDSTFARTKNSIPDSLANYLWKSTNQMFSLYYQAIFVQDNPNKVLSLFDSLIRTRAEQLNKLKPKLTDDEFGILEYQNKARVYSFLMFYGRIIKRYQPDNDFYQFIDNIDNENIYSKSFPDNLLYKFEIQLLRETDSIQSINSFLDFIEKQTKTKDLQEFLKAIYLKGVIEHPSYWRKHENLFTTPTVKEALRREQNNKYSHLVANASDSFYASQKGVKAFDFTAQKLDGTELKLSDLKGKLVIIDTWATWCGPCIDQRPNIIELAKKYKGNSDVVFLLVSVDNSIDKWKRYVLRTNENQYGIEVNIPDGISGEYGDKYLIKAIPKYILIDEDGIISNSNLPEPSIGMEQLIERALKKL